MGLAIRTRFGVGAVAIIAVAVVLSGCAASGSATQESSGATSEMAYGWESYADTDGDSSVSAYQIGEDFIQVEFTDGSVYVYTYASAGASDVEQMKELARAGDGLNSYIMNNAKYEYESKY